MNFGRNRLKRKGKIINPLLPKQPSKCIYKKYK